MVSCCCFSLSFFNEICWEYLRILMCHLCIFFGEVSFHIFCLLLIGLFFHLLILKTSLYMLNTSLLWDMYFKRSSPSLWLGLFILLMVSFLEPKFSILMKSNFFHKTISSLQIVVLVFYLPSHHQILVHLDFLLCLGVLQFCILPLGLWFILS